MFVFTILMIILCSIGHHPRDPSGPATHHDDNDDDRHQARPASRQSVSNCIDIHWTGIYIDVSPRFSELDIFGQCC